MDFEFEQPDAGHCAEQVDRHPEAFGSLLAVGGAGLVLAGLFLVIGKRMRIEEMTAMVGMVRGKLGR